MIPTILLLLTINQLPGPQYGYDDLMHKNGTNQYWYDGDPSSTPTPTPKSTQTPGLLDYEKCDPLCDSGYYESDYDARFIGRKWTKIYINDGYKCHLRKLGGAVCIRKRK